MYTVGIDIGGMSIKIGLVNDDGKIIAQSRFETVKDARLAVVKMVEHINALMTETALSISDIRGIGIGCPGSVSGDMIMVLPNLDWVKFPIVKELQKIIKLPVRISNDANVAALGEAIYGAAKNYDNCVMFTLGTGVGGGIILNKKLVECGSSLGAELGHATLIMDGISCTCGRKGCIERYVSATALITQTKEVMLKDKSSLMWEFVGGDIEKVDGRTAFECAKKGDKSAIIVQDTYVKYLSESILSMLNIFRPEAFILGGGISAQGKYLTEKVQDYCEKFEYGYKLSPRTEILTATLGNDAGIIGAAALHKN